MTVQDEPHPRLFPLVYTCMCTIIQIRAYNLNVNFLCKGREHGNEAGTGFHFEIL